MDLLIKFPFDPPSINTFTGIPKMDPLKNIRSVPDIAPTEARGKEILSPVPVDLKPFSPLLVSSNSST